MLYRARPLTGNPDEGQGPQHRKSAFWIMFLGCIGVVYGDIGTSPLYAFREAIVQASGGGVSSESVYGVLSLIIWALIVIVTLKYVLFLLRVDNRGEGGILSLMALAQNGFSRKSAFVLFLGLIGASLFYGDAAITPAISVLSAVEGLKLVTPAFEASVLPISVLILILLFSFQRHGTGSVSIFFGPVTAVWFLAIGLAGLAWIIKNPSILQAINPLHALNFFFTHGMISLIVLGAVFLAVTGAEALYADLGHFGLKPIQMAWFFLVFPCLLLNYLGQGAFVLAHPEGIENPFYKMVPEGFLIPMVVLATAATIIASQAVITGAYSITRQAVQLGLLPRLEIRHTSGDRQGQIYMPKVNNFLLLFVLLLCITFGNSSALASAYGISVTGTMLVTSILALVVMWKVRGKNLALCLLLAVPLIAIELTFLSSNMMKVHHGGFVPLMMAAFLVLLMSTWLSGTRYLRAQTHRDSISLADLVEKLERSPPTRIDGTAVFLTSESQDAPVALIQNLRHNKILHSNNIVLSVVISEFSKVPESQRIVIDRISSSMTRVFVNYGFMETPDVPAALSQAASMGLSVDLSNLSYFLGKRSIVSDAAHGLPAWQDKIYIAMAKSSANATDFYGIPSHQVVELGTQIAV